LRSSSTAFSLCWKPSSSFLNSVFCSVIFRYSSFCFLPSSYRLSMRLFIFCIFSRIYCCRLALAYPMSFSRFYSYCCADFDCRSFYYCLRYSERRRYYLNFFFISSYFRRSYWRSRGLRSGGSWSAGLAVAVA
jgi:hypothetical protein